MSESQGEPEGLRAEVDQLRAELARTRTELDRARDELAARRGEGGGQQPAGLLEGTLFISEVEVRSAIARQLRHGARLLQAEKCVYLLYDGTNELIGQRPALGLDEEQLGQFRTTVSRGVSGEVFRTRNPVKVDDVANDERAGEEPLGTLGVKNGICVPLLVQIRDEENRVIDSRAIGVLWVNNRKGAGAFSEDDVRLLTVFARQVAAVVSNAEFITKLQRDNQTLVSTFENLPAGILFVGEDERIHLVNGTARQLFGISDGRGIGEPYFRLIDHQPTCDVLGKSLRDDEDKVAEVPFEIDKEDRIFQIQAARVRGGDNSLNGVVAIFDDVSEVHRLDWMKQEFVQTFSTELLGPLASIHSFSSMLQQVAPDEFKGDMRREIQEVISGECLRLRRHIQDLLNVSRFDQGIRIHLNLRRFDFGAMVRRQMEQQAAIDRTHTFRIDLAPNLPEVQGDEARLEEVAYNLISNAIKYSPDGGEVRVQVARDGDQVRVAVHDEGIGIPEEHYETVFQKFTRVQQSDERIRGGRGIGLFISRFFVEAHSGEIGFQSTPDEGSTFWFTIPLQQMGGEPPENGR